MTAPMLDGKHAGLPGAWPVNLRRRKISCQQQLCTRCLICHANELNPSRQGCGADEYPSDLPPLKGRSRGIIHLRPLRRTPLNPAKTQRLSGSSPAFRQGTDENQRTDKHVESRLVRRLDSGSSPLTSTEKRATRLVALFSCRFQRIRRPC